MVGYDYGGGQDIPARSVLVTVAVATGEFTVVGELEFAGGQLHSFPRWSPDGDAMVLNVDMFSGDSFAGSTVAIVLRTESGWSEPEPITEAGELARPDWHPTDDLIVFCDYDIGGFESTDEPSNLYTIRADGSDLTQITVFGPGEARASQPSWTSDGRIIFAYVTGADDAQRDIAFVNADGSGLTIASDDEAVGQYNRPHPRLRPTTNQ